MRFEYAAFADEAGAGLDEQIRAMKDNGIKYLEIRGVDGENIADISVEKAKQIKAQLEANDLGVWSLGSPYGKIGITEEFAPHLEKFKRGMELAHVLGAKHIRLFSFYIPAGKYQEYREEVFDRMHQFLDVAEGSDIILCHENEKGIYGDMADRCAELHKEFPTLKAVFDPANFIQCGQNTLAAWTLLESYVEYMHIKDALEDGTVVPAGKGVGNISWLLGNYQGRILTLEPHLSVFEGLDKLEGDEKTKMGYCYPSSRVAFDAAVEALNSII